MWNIAHRGGAALWPENTLYAFREAARAGYDGAELDVQLTHDDKLVVFHDFQLSPDLCRDDAGWVREMPLIKDMEAVDLTCLDVGRVRLGALRPVPRQSRDGERIPLLSEVIDTVRSVRTDFRLLIELKSSLNPKLSASGDVLAAAVLEELERLSFHHAVLVGFDWAALRAAKKRAPAMPFWFTTDAKRHPFTVAEDIRLADADGWFAHLCNASEEALAAARGAGLKFAVWGVEREADMRRLIALGVEAICTDYPDVLARLTA